MASTMDHAPRQEDFEVAAALSDGARRDMFLCSTPQGWVTQSTNRRFVYLMKQGLVSEGPSGKRDAPDKPTSCFKATDAGHRVVKALETGKVPPPA